MFLAAGKAGVTMQVNNAAGQAATTSGANLPPLPPVFVLRLQWFLSEMDKRGGEAARATGQEGSGDYATK